MPRETLSTRVSRIETVMAALAEKQLELDGTVKVLLDAQIKNEQRFDSLGQRIDGLVSAIGELIRRQYDGR